MGAAGLNPPVASPVLPNIQSIIRAQPQANALVLLIVLIAAGLLFIGGVLGDADGRRGILIGALGVLVGVNALGLIITNEPLFIASRLASGAAAYAVLPFAMALVATTYSGVVRATAIGIVYAVYAGGTAVSPILLTILGPDGPRWPGFVVGSVCRGHRPVAGVVARTQPAGRRPRGSVVRGRDRSVGVRHRHDHVRRRGPRRPAR